VSHLAKNTEVKEKNRGAILSLLYKKKQLSKKTIAQELHLSAAVISKICGELAEDDLIKDNHQVITHKVGRRELLISVNTEDWFCLGITIDQTGSTIVLSDLHFNCIQSVNIKKQENGNNHIQTIISEIETILTADYVPKKRILGIGISVRGLTDGKSSIYGIWKNAIAIKEPIEEAINLPVIIDNGIRCSSLYESLTSNLENFIFFKYMKPGIGATFLKDGIPYHGESNLSMEIGHVIIDPQGKYCPFCHRKGCLESMISIDTILSEARDNFSQKWSKELYALCHGNKKEITLEKLIQSAEQGSIQINTILNRCARYFALAVINTYAIVDINKIIIVGDLFESERFKEYFRSAIHEFQLTPFYDKIELRPTKDIKLSPVALAISSFLPKV